MQDAKWEQASHLGRQWQDKFPGRLNSRVKGVSGVALDGCLGPGIALNAVIGAS